MDGLVTGIGALLLGGALAGFTALVARVTKTPLWDLDGFTGLMFPVGVAIAGIGLVVLVVGVVSIMAS
jgi:hypothetical protein